MSARATAESILKAHVQQLTLIQTVSTFTQSESKEDIKIKVLRELDEVMSFMQFYIS